MLNKGSSPKTEPEEELVEIEFVSGREVTVSGKKPVALIRELGQRGVNKDEAGNLVAAMFGLAPSTKKPWTGEQINRVLFNRWLVERDHTDTSKDPA